MTQEMPWTWIEYEFDVLGDGHTVYLPGNELGFIWFFQYFDAWRDCFVDVITLTRTDLRILTWRTKRQIDLALNND